MEYPALDAGERSVVAARIGQWPARARILRPDFNQQWDATPHVLGLMAVAEGTRWHRIVWRIGPRPTAHRVASVSTGGCRMIGRIPVFTPAANLRLADQRSGHSHPRESPSGEYPRRPGSAKTSGRWRRAVGSSAQRGWHRTNRIRRDPACCARTTRRNTRRSAGARSAYRPGSSSVESVEGGGVGPLRSAIGGMLVVHCMV